MENDLDFLKEINGQSFTKISDLQINKKYQVKMIEKVLTNYGIRIQVICKDIKFTLPESWTERMTNENINKLLQKPIYIIYKGKKSLPNDKCKHDLSFVRE